jgi:GNAT acetyltransferase-like protein
VADAARRDEGKMKRKHQLHARVRSVEAGSEYAGEIKLGILKAPVSADIRIDVCREEDVPVLMRFIDAHWSTGHILSRDESLLRWQYDPSRIAGGALEGPAVLLAWHREEVVGMLGLTGFDWNVEGIPMTGAWLSQWLVEPEKRSRGVAMRLLGAARAFGLEVLATLGANDVVTKVLSTLGWALMPDVPRWIGVMDHRQAAALLTASDAAVAPEVAEWLCQRHRVADCMPVHPSAEHIDVVLWTPACAGPWDRYWREQLAGTLVGTRRDAAYLRWRYVEHPRFRYELRLARRRVDGSVLGIAVFRVEQVRERRERVLRVVEFLASPEAEVTLAKAVAQAGREQGVAFADFYCSSPRAARGLKGLGFKLAMARPGEAGFPCRLQPLEGGHFRMTGLVQVPPGQRGNLARLIDAGRLYLTKSDGDQDRPN